MSSHGTRLSSRVVKGVSGLLSSSGGESGLFEEDPQGSQYNPMDHSPPVSSVHGILRATVVEWVAMPSSRVASQPRDRTHLLWLLLCSQILYL